MKFPSNQKYYRMNSGQIVEGMETLLAASSRQASDCGMASQLEFRSTSYPTLPFETVSQARSGRAQGHAGRVFRRSMAYRVSCAHLRVYSYPWRPGCKFGGGNVEKTCL